MIESEWKLCSICNSKTVTALEEWFSVPIGCLSQKISPIS